VRSLPTLYSPDLVVNPTTPRSFRRSDGPILALGYHLESPHRIHAALLTTADEARPQEHTLPALDLAKKTARTLGLTTSTSGYSRSQAAGWRFVTLSAAGQKRGRLLSLARKSGLEFRGNDHSLFLPTALRCGR
jgi:hypothetical protein